MADMILLGLAVICTAYFMIIVFYAGMGTSFAFIWLFFAALCVFLVYGKWYYKCFEMREFTCIKSYFVFDIVR